MGRIALALAVLMMSTSVGHAQYKDVFSHAPNGSAKFDAPRITVKGYLVDKVCAYRSNDLEKLGPTHTTDCALKAEVLGVVQRGVFYPFDDKGTKRAMDLLKKSKVTVGVMVQVTGNMEGNAFTVATLKEIKPTD